MSVTPLSSSARASGSPVSAPAQAAKPSPQVSPQSPNNSNGAKLSGKALAKSLDAQGLTPWQIAAMMGTDLKTVDEYLGITAPKRDDDEVKLSGKALAKSLKEQGLTPWQIAMTMGSDIKTVDDYLGITPTPNKLLYNSSAKTISF